MAKRVAAALNEDLHSWIVARLLDLVLGPKRNHHRTTSQLVALLGPRRRLRRQRDAMRTAHLRFQRRDFSKDGVEIEFLPLRRAKLSGTHEGEKQQLQRASGFRRAFVAVIRAKEPTESLGLDDRRPLVHDGRSDCALERPRRIALGAACGDGEAEHFADGRAKPAGGFEPAP